MLTPRDGANDQMAASGGASDGSSAELVCAGLLRYAVTMLDVGPASLRYRGPASAASAPASLRYRGPASATSAPEVASPASSGRTAGPSLPPDLAVASPADPVASPGAIQSAAHHAALLEAAL